ncbi:endolysin [Arthrobacter phage Marchesin]|nr:endolysin [Arthrobacter phage Marchesin]
MCVNGRSDLPGPLCNAVFGRNGTVYLVAAGVANHAGVGELPGIPRNMGNHYLFGIEMESSGVAPWDWTEDQIRVAPYFGAALELELLGHLPPESRIQAGHLEYSSEGKIDPAGWPGGMDGLRSSINALLGGGGTIQVAGGVTSPLEEDDMAVSPSFEPNVRASLQNITNVLSKLPALDRDLRARFDVLGDFESDVREDLAAKGAELAGLRAAVVALSDKSGTVSSDAVLEAVEGAVERFMGQYRLTVQRADAPAVEEVADNG